MICFLKPILFTVLAVFCFANESFAKLKLGSPFGDHMVLQHDQPVKIWGWAQAGESVSVTIKDQTTTAIAGDDGKWKMQMAAPGLGEPFSVKIAGAAESIQLADVVGGEVWVCGGQSNMEWYVKNSKDADAEIAAARYPMIRLFNTPHRTSLVPNDEVGNSGWRVCSPKTVGDFTAVGYYFARELHRELDIPVGLVSSNWGGTIIEAWISGSSLKTHADFKARVEEMEQVGEDPQHDKTLAMKVDAWMKNYRKMQRVPAETWQSAALDDSGWGQQKLPAHELVKLAIFLLGVVIVTNIRKGLFSR